VLGTELAPLQDSNALAIGVWNALTNGMGGIDWSGLPLQVELLGIDDVETLCEALVNIKLYRMRRDHDDDAGPDEDDTTDTETL
jgi:hypothetical protein